MNHELKITLTADGSNTIYNPEVGENYHSRNGALQESRHVFVNSGLNYFLTKNNVKEVSVLEVGFGTGLNFLLSADLCINQKVKLYYTGIEAYPLSTEMIGKTGYDQYTSSTLWQQFMDNYEGLLGSSVALNTYCTLQIANCKLLNYRSANKYDIIYFDAFAASHQPEMWNEESIAHTIQFLKPSGIFVTYAITGNLKRMLKALGLTIQKIPGAAGKREMLRGCADF
ncbi:MAG: tRNA (5-methylaminomethyl-2-thiouridylate)-methyltransferase [Mucilaginibacter sp.]|nr:tRNA (5-methylaminomethyl-2-thiouridylate)-methyltransferase [Mucilaginibacter sp.]